MAGPNGLTLADLGTVPLPRPRPGPFEQALGEYPILQNLGISATYSPERGGSNMLEFFPAGETGAPNAPRPKELPIDRPGLEIYSKKTRPVDVLGDVVSHELVNTDPTVKAYYEKFAQSLGPDQKAFLRDRYVYDRKNFGETRPYAVWEKMSGLPAYFRGYAFEQWPADFNEQVYTPQQRSMFDEMLQYLKRRP